MSNRDTPKFIKVKGQLYRLAKPRGRDWKQTWPEEYEDPEPAPSGVQTPEYHGYRDPEAREFFKRMDMKDNDVRWQSLRPLFHSLVGKAFDRVLAHMNSGELTEDVQHQLAEKLNQLDLAISMFDPWSRQDPPWILDRLADIEQLTHDPDIFKFDGVKGLHPEGPIKLQDIVKEIDKEGHLKDLGFTLGMGHETYQSAKRRAVAPVAPVELHINGRVYRRADEGPGAESTSPEPMSDADVLAATLGIDPGAMDEHKDLLNAFTNPKGEGLYDVLKGARKQR